MAISKQFQRYHQDDVGRKIEEIIDMVNNNTIDKVSKTDTSEQTIEGNLTVNGILTQREYELDNDFTISFAPDAQEILSCYYSHARVSNGKLSVVISLYMPSNSVEQKTIPSYTSLFNNGVLSLPSTILDKIQSAPLNFIDIKSVSGQTSGYGTLGNLTLSCVKVTNGIAFQLQAPNDIVQSSSDYGQSIWRFEFNFLLS